MRKWMGIPLALLLIIGLHASAWANSELHTGGRLFFPLWDVSTPNRLTFIIITREAMRGAARASLGPGGPRLAMLASWPGTLPTNVWAKSPEARQEGWTRRATEEGR